jgi:hypothetical protein
MAAYIVPFAIVAFCSFLSLDRKLRVVQLYPFIFIALILFVGLRYASIDYFTYKEMFNYVSRFSELGFFNYTPQTGEKPTESLYSLLVLIVKLFGGGYVTFIFIVSLLSLGIKIYAFRKMSNYFYLSLLIYVATWMGNDMGQIRNGLASGLVLLSVIFVADKKFFKFSSVVFSAALVHFVAALALPLYFIKKAAKPYLMTVVLGVSYLTAFFGGLGMVIIERVSGALGLGIDFRLVRYMDSKYAEGYSVFGGTIIMHMFIAISAIFLYVKLTKVNAYNNVLIPMYVYGVSAMLFFVDYGIMVARIKDLMCISSGTIILPSFLLIFKEKYRMYIYILIVIYSSMMFFGVSSFAPYGTIIFN